MFRTIRTLVPLLLFLLHAASLQASELHRAWGELLGRHVGPGVVDYQGFKKDEQQLDMYLDLLDQTDPDTLSDADRLAYFINAYNSYTVKLILDNFKDGQPPSSIRKIGGLFSSPWKIKFVKLGGKTYSLDNVEHDIIRPRFKEPRIHFAVNCASKSCPPLISEPYDGSRLDTQLEKVTREFLADSTHNRVEGDTLYVSSLFKWYGEDFQDEPAAFFLSYTDGELRERINRLGSDARVKYLDYDWSLNDGGD
jgi:hypothetical protein